MLHRDRVRDYIVENFLFGDGHDFKDADSLRDKGIIDSTGVLELIAFLEKTFEIRIEDDEIIPDNLDSVEYICEFLQRKQLGIQNRRVKVAID